MAGLSPELHRDTRRVLLACASFDSDRDLRALFTDPRLSPWRDRVPEASNRQSRVQGVVALLVDAANIEGDNGLVLLAQALLDLIDPQDTLHADLQRLSNELAAAFRSNAPSRYSTSTAVSPPTSITITGDGNVVGYGSSSHVVKITDSGAIDTSSPEPQPVYCPMTIRLFEHDTGEMGLSNGPFPVELTVPGGRDFPRGQLTLDRQRLTALEADADAYGRALGEMLFDKGALGDAYGEALAVAQARGHTPRVHLRIDEPQLRIVRWERVYHPIAGTWYPLATTSDALLSRYVPMDVWDKPRLVTARPVRVLVVIASPRDLDRYGLAAIDADERATWHAIFDPLPGAHVSYLESGTTDVPTLSGLRQALMGGCDLVQVVCHGMRTFQGTTLLLEKADGNADLVESRPLLEMLHGLPVRPAFACLAACESGAADLAQGFVALGPGLVAQGGVAAVVAMADRVGLLAARQFAGCFYERLLTHGTVDLAVHEARAHVRERWDWSVPVLFSSLSDNRLWTL